MHDRMIKLNGINDKWLLLNFELLIAVISCILFWFCFIAWLSVSLLILKNDKSKLLFKSRFQIIYISKCKKL